MEEASLSAGGPRVRFNAVWKGTLDNFIENNQSLKPEYEDLCLSMKKHLHIMEEYGVTPILPDGKVGGNAGAILKTDNSNVLIVTKSGKQAKADMDFYRDFVVVTSFNKVTWTCEYYSNDKEVLPTSDTPLHFTALSSILDGNLLGWKQPPKYILHGHAFANEKDAEKFGFPISTCETLCSTPADSKALYDLMALHSFPKDKVYIRKGHGFVLLGESADDAWNTFCNRIEPFITTKNGNTEKSNIAAYCLVYIYLPVVIGLLIKYAR